MEIFTVKPCIPYGSNCYVIRNNDSWAVIDPSASFNEIKACIPDISETPKYVLLTHAHFDHILNIDDYVSRGAKVYVGARDGEGLGSPYYNCYKIFLNDDCGYNGEYEPLSEYDVIDLDGLPISVIETPGHTAGSVCYLVGDAAFVGDLIFEGGSYGRYDLPSGDRNTLFNSIDKFYKLFPRGRIYSGHGNTFLI